MLAVLAACLLPLSASAHGSREGRAERVTGAIEADPSNPEVHLASAALHREYGDWDAALAAIDRAHALERTRADFDLQRGRVLFEAGRFAEARESLSRFLLHEPKHPTARLVRARALAKLGLPLAAADDYDVAIAQHEPPIPDHYLERARALAEGPEPQLERALRGLDEGTRAFGSLVTLDLYAIELELRRGNPNAALGRLDRIAAASARQESWLVRRAEILESAGHAAEARAHFERGLAELRSLPPHRRANPAMKKLQTRALTGLERLSANGGSPR